MNTIKNKIKNCDVCGADRLVTIMAYNPVRVMVSCACCVQFLDAQEAKDIMTNELGES